MASGLIYVAIIGMWVAYFLPRWVHDRNEFSGKSIERYKSALRVVANSSPGGSSGSGVIHTDLDHEAKVAQRLMQRRITFAILIIPLTGIIIYVAHVRRQTISEKLYKRRIRNLQKGQSGTSGTNLSEVVSNVTQKEHWIPLSERELSGVVILPKGSAENRGAWQPNEVPVPTYVNAPKAVTPRRTIDLTTPGQWSDDQERLAREALAAATPSRDQVFDQDLAEQAVEKLNRSRAANE